MKQKENFISSRLITLLSSFTKDEFKTFGSFVSSVYFNREKVLSELYTILKKNYPEFSGKDFTREKVYESLFPGKSYNDAVLRNTFSKMLSLVESFLSLNHFLNDDFYKEFFLLKELKSKKQEKLFAKHKAETDNNLEANNYKNEDYFYKKYLLEDLEENFKRITKDSMVLVDKKALKSYDHLTDSLLTGMFKANATIINSNKNFFGEKQNYIFLEELEMYLGRNPEKLRDNIYINYYYNTIKLFQTDDDKYFFNLLKIINNSLDQLKDIDRKDVFTALTNYCYYKINNGELRFIEEQFKLYKINIQQGVYKGTHDFISHILFMNVVTCSLEAGEFDWVKEFINKYISELKEEHKENMYNFSFALFYYWKRDFNRSIEFASKIMTDDLSYKHQIKSLYLKIYFDLNETEPFYSHIDTYRHFVNNDKLLPEDNKNYILNYIYFSRKLFDLKNTPGVKDEYETGRLKQEISDHKALINKSWLLRKC